MTCADLRKRAEEWYRAELTEAYPEGADVERELNSLAALLCAVRVEAIEECAKLIDGSVNIGGSILASYIRRLASSLKHEEGTP